MAIQFPTQVVNYKYPISIVERASMEGMLLLNGTTPHTVTFPTNYAFNGSMTAAANGEVIPASGSIVFSRLNPITKITVIKNINIFTSAATRISVNNLFVRNNTKYYHADGSNSLNITDPFFIYPKESCTIKIDGLETSTPADGKIYGYGSVESYRISADTNYSAQHTIMLIGDSNMEGSSVTVGVPGTGVTAENIWTWILRKWYIDKGNDVRLLDCSVSGQTTAFFDELRQSGRIQTIEDPSVIVYNLGTNDGSASTAATNLDNYIKWALSKYRNLHSFIVIAPVNAENSARQTLNQQMATAYQTVVNNINSPKVFYINPVDAYTATDSTNYSGTESAGSGIHISVLGHSRVATNIINKLELHDTESAYKLGKL